MVSCFSAQSIIQFGDPLSTNHYSLQGYCQLPPQVQQPTDYPCKIPQFLKPFPLRILLLGCSSVGCHVQSHFYPQRVKNNPYACRHKLTCMTQAQETVAVLFLCMTVQAYHIIFAPSLSCIMPQKMAYRQIHCLQVFSVYFTILASTKFTILHFILLRHITYCYGCAACFFPNFLGN